MGQHRPYVRMLKKALDNLEASSVSDATKKAARKAYREVEVEVSGRLTCSAGNARARILRGEVISTKIKLSRSIFATISDEEKFNTVSHEFAHVVDYYVRGDSDHSYQWKMLHMAMGGSAKRTHNYTVQHRTVTRYVVEDTVMGTVRKITKGNWKKYQRWNPSRYKLLDVVRIKR